MYFHYFYTFPLITLGLSVCVSLMTWLVFVEHLCSSPAWLSDWGLPPVWVVLVGNVIILIFQNPLKNMFFSSNGLMQNFHKLHSWWRKVCVMRDPEGEEGFCSQLIKFQIPTLPKLICQLKSQFLCHTFADFFEILDFQGVLHLATFLFEFLDFWVKILIEFLDFSNFLHFFKIKQYSCLRMDWRWLRMIKDE